MTEYTYSQVIEATTTYFDGDEFAAKVFVDKYALQNKEGIYLELTPTDMHNRLAREFARIESKYPNPLSETEIFSFLDRFKYLVPQGSPMSAIGNKYQLQSLSNCFVIQGVYSDKLDSYGGIMLADQELAQIMKRRGGCGCDISGIRPKNAITANAAKTTDGIAVFMDRFSNTCREVAQNGRRGAEMLTISGKHPEVETFINIKRDLKRVTGANITVRIYDDFMNSVKNNEDYILRWPVDVSPIDAKIILNVKALDIWNKLVDSAWSSAEPGVSFWDNVIKNTPSDIYKNEGYESISMNPCGELILSKNDACRLLTINLSSYIINPFTSSAYFDYELFNKHAIIAQRLMDDIVDLEIECIDRILQKVKIDPEPPEVKIVELNLWKKIKKAIIGGRRTGLGPTAVGDAIAMMNIKYGSKESIDFTYKVYRALAVGAHTSSCILAKERGAFPVFSYEKEKTHEYLNNIMNDVDDSVREMWKNTGRRNIALTTTAPTGSVSILTQTTSGIEPAYMLNYVRRKKINPSDKDAKIDFIDDMGDQWQEFTIHHNGVKQWMNITGKTDIKDSPYWGATATEIDWLASVEIQAAAQKSVDHSISKTCVLPANATKELVSQIYMKAWESGCKGFTVYREGSRSGVLINESDSKTNTDLRPKNVIASHSPKRPEFLPCDIHQTSIKGTKWVVLVGLFNGQPYEIFLGDSESLLLPPKCNNGKLLKNGHGIYNLYVDIDGEDLIIKNVVKTFNNAENAWATRIISMSLRHGVPIEFIVEQLSKDGGMGDMNKAISRILKKYISNGTKVKSKIKCPECNSEDIVFIEGCMSCKKCSWSKCS